MKKYPAEKNHFESIFLCNLINISFNTIVVSDKYLREEEILKLGINLISEIIRFFWNSFMLN